MVAALLEQLGVADVTAVGHSFGADVAVALGAKRAGVPRVMIVGQAPDLVGAHMPRGGAIMTLGPLGALLHRLSPARALRPGARVGFAPGFDQRIGYDDPDQVVADLRAMHPAMYATILRERKAVMAEHPLDAQSLASPAATTVVLGRHDQFYDCEPTAARYRAAGFPVQVIEGSGHSPNVETPDELADAIRAFAGR
jgi:pimeloyl-ACP methyl ester carboxylesterase